MTRHLHIKAVLQLHHTLFMGLFRGLEWIKGMRKIHTDLYVLRIFHIAIFFRLIPNLLLRNSSPGSSTLRSFRSSQIHVKAPPHHANPMILPNDFSLLLSTVVDRVRRGQHDVFGRRKKDFTPTTSSTNTTPSWLQSSFSYFFVFGSCKVRTKS